MSLSKSQIRCMDCLKTGFIVHADDDIRFMTLTTAVGMKCSLMVAFAELKKRIFRMTPLKMINDGYLDGNRLNDFYPDTALNDHLKFSYLAVKTSEGVSGVLHILFAGDFFPYRWLSDTWEDITGTAKVVDISKVKDVVKAGKYIVLQRKVLGYVAGQSKYVRFSYSSDWVFDGYANLYREFTGKFWYSELSRIAVTDKYRDTKFLNFYDLFKSLSKSEKIDFYNKRWSEWLKIVKNSILE